MHPITIMYDRVVNSNAGVDMNRTSAIIAASTKLSDYDNASCHDHVLHRLPRIIANPNDSSQDEDVRHFQHADFPRGLVGPPRQPRKIYSTFEKADLFAFFIDFRKYATFGQ